MKVVIVYELGVGRSGLAATFEAWLQVLGVEVAGRLEFADLLDKEGNSRNHAELGGQLQNYADKLRSFELRTAAFRISGPHGRAYLQGGIGGLAEAMNYRLQTRFRVRLSTLAAAVRARDSHLLAFLGRVVGEPGVFGPQNFSEGASRETY